MPQAFYILAGAALTVAACWALGKLLLGSLSIQFHRGEEHVFAFVGGSACLSTIVFLLCATGLARKGVFVVLSAAAIGIALRTRASGHHETLPELPRFWRLLFLTVFATFGVLYFFNAMAPEMSPDGATYHLGLVSRYLREHGFRRITTHMYANLSQGIEMLYLAAFSVGRHSAAALVHFAFLATLPWAMLFYARRFGFGPAGVCGAIFAFASPVFGIDGTTAYIDVAVATIAFTLFYLLQIWDAERKPALLIPIGILAGFSFAAKYTAFVAVPYAAGFIVWKTFRAKQASLRSAAVVCACAALMMAPWLVKNWIVLRNPVSPFLNELFPNPYIHVSFEKDYTHYMRNYDNLKSHWDIPVEVTVRGWALVGLLGPLFLLAPVSLLALGHPAGRQLLLAGLVFGSTYAANIGTRFLIPATPFFALAMALVFIRWKAVAVALALAHAVISWPSVLIRYSSPYAWRLEKIPLKQALRIESEESYLNFKMPRYAVARMIERLVPPGERVFSFSQAPEAYTGREILVAYQSAFNNVMGDILWTPLIAVGQPTWLLRFHIQPEPLRKIRIIQEEGPAPDQWSVHELRVFHNQQELPRRPEWRLRARPNPWDVQLAFDNSPITRWRSWQSLYPGMFVEVDFGALQSIEEVLLECAHDQYRVRLRLEGQDSSGRWKVLSSAPEQSEALPPIGLRRAAAEEFKLRGIRYLLAYDSDFGADDYRTNSALWGMQLVGEANDARLYRFD